MTSQLHKAANQKNIPGVDAMRALAIGMVLTFHMGLPVSSALGVTTFFVLSGFLITGILMKEVSRTGTIALGRFYSRRTYRIFPAYYLAWFLTMGTIVLQHGHLKLSNILETFFYFGDYGRAFLPLKAQQTYAMGISWSLAVEEKFYLLWPIALIWISKSKKNCVQLVAFIIGALWLWRALLVCVFDVSWDYAYNAFDTRADALMVGCLLALCIYSKERAPRLLLMWLRSKRLVLIPTGLIITGSTLSALGKLGPRSQVIEFSIAPILIAVLLLQFIFWGLHGWALVEHPIIKLIARLSYSLYLYHPLAFVFMPLELKLLPVPHGGKILALIAAFLMASASYYGVERPFIKLRDRNRRQSVIVDDGLAREG